MSLCEGYLKNAASSNRSGFQPCLCGCVTDLEFPFTWMAFVRLLWHHETAPSMLCSPLLGTEYLKKAKQWGSEVNPTRDRIVFLDATNTCCWHGCDSILVCLCRLSVERPLCVFQLPEHYFPDPLWVSMTVASSTSSFDPFVDTFSAVISWKDALHIGPKMSSVLLRQFLGCLNSSLGFVKLPLHTEVRTLLTYIKDACHYIVSPFIWDPGQIPIFH